MQRDSSSIIELRYPSIVNWKELRDNEMKIIDAIKLCIWLIEHNENKRYDTLLDFLIEELNEHLNKELWIRGYRTDRI